MGKKENKKADVLEEIKCMKCDFFIRSRRKLYLWFSWDFTKIFIF